MTELVVAFILAGPAKVEAWEPNDGAVGGERLSPAVLLIVDFSEVAARDGIFVGNIGCGEIEVLGICPKTGDEVLVGSVDFVSVLSLSLESFPRSVVPSVEMEMKCQTFCLCWD